MSKIEYAPILVSNPEKKVTFQCDQATPFDLIRAVGFQTRIPIGVVLGRDLDALSKTSRSYDLEDVDAKSALSEAVEGIGYSIKDENGVILLIADDLFPRQRDILVHEHSKFWAEGGGSAMVCYGMVLSGWIRQIAHPGSGFGFSCATSTNEEVFKLNVAPVATTEEIANQIVSQGSRGMWILKVSASASIESTERIDIQPYQHYSNRAVHQD